MPDPETLKFYADNAADYVRHVERPTPQLAPFLARLPPGGAILELGTGNGRDAAAMLSAGFLVPPPMPPRNWQPRPKSVWAFRSGSWPFINWPTTLPMTASGLAPDCRTRRATS